MSDNHDDVDVDKIAHDAVARARQEGAVEDDEPSLRLKLAALLAGLIILVNTVVGVYNSFALHAQVQCNHQLQITLAVVGDQNRNITKDAIDAALSGTIRTKSQLITIKNNFDKGFAENTTRRNQVLSNQCQ